MIVQIDLIIEMCYDFSSIGTHIQKMSLKFLKYLLTLDPSRFHSTQNQ